jgi:hypothetical protein
VATSGSTPAPLAAQPSVSSLQLDAAPPEPAPDGARVESGPPPQASWTIEASLSLLGISLLGSTPSSACLKAEWRGLRASCCAAAGAPGGGLAAQASWQRLSLHVLQPRETHGSFEFTPFASGLGPGLGMGGLPGSPGSGGELSLHPQGPQGLARRSLSAGLGLAGAAGGSGGQQEEEVFQEPMPYLLARFNASSAASRYYSAADSEFEDAASSLPDGAQQLYECVLALLRMALITGLPCLLPRVLTAAARHAPVTQACARRRPPARAPRCCRSRSRAATSRRRRCSCCARPTAAARAASGRWR